MGRFEIVVKNGKHYLLEHKDNGEVIEILSGFDYIHTEGLIQRQSDYILVEKDGKEYLYEYKDGKFIELLSGFKTSNTEGFMNSIVKELIELKSINDFKLNRYIEC